MTTADAIFMQRFEDYKQFNEVSEMDAHVKEVTYYFAEELNATTKAVLDYMKQRSCTVVGVSYIKVATIAAAVGKSVRTINYATKKLVDLGIIKKIETMRKKRGGDGANGYAILSSSLDDCRENCRVDCSGEIAERYDDATPTESKDETPKSEGLSLNSFNSFKAPNKSLKTFEKNNAHMHVHTQEEKIVEVYPNTPNELRMVLVGFDNARINALVKRIVTAYGKSDIDSYMNLQDLCKVDADFSRELAAHVKQAITNWKNGEVYGELEGYIYVTARNYFNEVAAQKDMSTDSEEELSFEGFYEIAGQALRIRKERTNTFTPIESTHSDLDELGIF